MSDETKRARSGATTPSAVEQWNRAVAEAYAAADSEADVARAPATLEASDAEIERRLRDAGFDLADLDARADAAYASVVAKHFAGPATKDPDESQREPVWVAEAGPRARAVPPPRRSRVIWVACAIAAAATGGAAYVAAHRHDEPRHDEPVVPPAPPITPVITPPVTPPPPVSPTPLPRTARPPPRDSAHGQAARTRGVCTRTAPALTAPSRREN